MENLSHIAKQLKESNDRYEQLFDHKTFNIRTEDGENIEFIIERFNLPHLLGIKATYYLRRPEKYKSMYHFMQSIINSPNEFEQKISNGELSIGDIFVKHISQKVACFNSLQSINKYTIPFLIKFDSYTINELFNAKCDYFIYFGNILSSYHGFLLGLKKDSKRKRGYAPSSLITVKSEKQLSNLIGEQCLSIIREIEIHKKGTYIKNNIEHSDEEIEELRNYLQNISLVANPKLEETFEKPESIELLRKQSTEIAKLKTEYQKHKEQTEALLQALKEEYDLAQNKLANANRELEIANNRINDTESELQQIETALKSVNEQIDFANNHPFKYVMRRVFKKKQ